MSAPKKPTTDAVALAVGALTEAVRDVQQRLVKLERGTPLDFNDVLVEFGSKLPNNVLLSETNAGRIVGFKQGRNWLWYHSDIVAYFALLADEQREKESAAKDTAAVDAAHRATAAAVTAKQLHDAADAAAKEAA